MLESLNITLRLPEPTPRFVREVYTTDTVALHQGDSLALLPQLPAASVDCVVTDPAYWTLDEHRDIGTTTRLGGGTGLGDFEPEDRGWFKTITAEELFFCMREFARVLRPNTHCWVMADGRVAGFLSLIAEHLTDDRGRRAFGYWKLFPVLKRAKSDPRRFRLGMGYHGRGAHEYVVLLKKGGKQTGGGRPMKGGKDVPDVFEHVWSGAEDSKRFTPDGEKYPTAKPASLYRQLLGFSVEPGETVLDCFAGSGPLVEAAAEAGCKAILCDRSPRAIKTIQNRALAAVAGQSTPLPLRAAEEKRDDDSPLLF